MGFPEGPSVRAPGGVEYPLELFIFTLKMNKGNKSLRI